MTSELTVRAETADERTGEPFITRRELFVGLVATAALTSFIVALDPTKPDRRELPKSNQPATDLNPDLANLPPAQERP